MMRNFKLIANKKALKDVVYKVTACILCIMMVAAVMTPSFAANSKATNASLKSKSIVSLKQTKWSTKTRLSKSTKKHLKDTKIYNLNSSNNVRAMMGSDGNLVVRVKNFDGDRNIERQKWIDMVKALGGKGLNWAKTKFAGKMIIADEVYLPEDSSHIFYCYTGALEAADNFNTSNVTNMEMMFKSSKIEKVDLSKWDVSKVKSSGWMFNECDKLEYIKTPKGLETHVLGVSKEYKVVRLKKGSMAEVEYETRYFNTEFKINAGRDKEATYDIYRKDKYAGIIFNHNLGDKPAFRDHAIVEKGKSIKDSGDELPAINPKKEGSVFLGWAKNLASVVPDFDENSAVDNDITVHAMWSDFPLNIQENVRAKVGNDGNMTISIADITGDRSIERQMWFDMIRALGGMYLSWGNSTFKGNIKIGGEVYLPADSSKTFHYFKGNLTDIDKFNTSKVTDMQQMFKDSEIKKANICTWDVGKVTKSAKMFEKCKKIEYIKTPVGLKTSVSGVDKDFKVVKLKKGSEASVEHESKNLNSEFDINPSGDKEASYNIYRKDTHVGITFDKNGGNSSAFRNHEIIEKGKSIKDFGGRLPEIKPEREGYEFLGWSKSKTATAPDFDENNIVRGDITVYAVWRSSGFSLNSTGNVKAKMDSDGNMTISIVNLPGDKNIERDKWIDMIKATGGQDINWENSSFTGNMKIDSEVYLPEDSSYMFAGFRGNLIGADKLDTSRVTSIAYMFKGAMSINPDVSKWNVSKVTNMSFAFYGAKLADPDVSDWNTSSVTVMKGMFEGASSAKPDVSKWNTSNVTNMGRMFMGSVFEVATLANPDVSNWDVSKVTDMGYMFYRATSAKPDVSKWNTSKVTDMRNMFNGATSAKPDVSKWNTSKVTDMRNMFNGATSANPDVSGWDTSKVTDMSVMFGGAISANPDVSKWNTSNVTSMNNMFNGATSANPDVSGWDTSKVIDMSYMFGKSGIKKINLSKWKLNEEVLKGNNTQDMFSGCSKLEYLKTPAGMRTNISVAGDEDFKIVLLRKGESPVVEKESENLKNGYIINNNNNRDVLTHIYRKDKYVGVVFDKNGGNYEGWMNHEIVSKDKNIKDSKGVLPETKPEREGHKFLGWSKSKIATVPDFDENTIVNGDTTAYAVWAAPKVNITFYGNSGEGEMSDVKVNKGSEYELPVPTFTPPAGKEFDKWSVTVGVAAPVDKQPGEKITASDNVKIKALWKTKPIPKVVVTLDGNGGVLAGGASATVAVDKGSAVKEQLEAAVANKIFTKDGYRLIGFSKSKFATQADYNLDSPVYSDTTLYAVYEETNEVTKLTIKYTEVGMDEDEVIENVPLGKAIGDKLDGHERALAGHRFLGYSKEKNAVKPDFFKNSIVTENLGIYPVYKETGNVDKAKVAFKLNDGTDGSLKTQEVTRYESLGDKMPAKDKVAERDGYLFTGWAKSKAARYPDFFRGTTVKGDMTAYAVWKSLYDEKLGQAVLKVSAKAKGYELTIEPPTANLHTGFEIFRSEKKDFKPSKDNMIATVDRDALKYLDEKADNGKAYYYAVRAIDADGSYNGTKVTYIGKLSDKVLATPLPKDKGVTATVTGKGAVGLEFNKTIAAAKYKVTVTAPYDKKFKTIERFVEADKLVAATAGKVKASVTGLPTGKFLAFKLEALEADNNKLVEYGNSFAFMLGAVDKLSAKVNRKKRVLNIKFKAMKGVSGYEAKIVIGGKVKTIKLKKGKKKLKGFIVGSIKLPKKKGKYTFTVRAFKKIGKLKYYGQTITKMVK